MTITVEDGTIVALANAWGSLADADTYHEDRGNASWAAASDEDKEAAMIRATAGLESKYRERWIGFKSNFNTVTAPQFLAWPRKKDKLETTAAGFALATMTKLTDFDNIEIGVDEVPLVLIHAFFEVALVELTQPFVSTELSRENMVKYERVDVIETEFFRNSPAVVQFPHIDNLLSGIASTAAVKLGAVIGLTEGEQDELDSTDAFERWLAQNRST